MPDRNVVNTLGATLDERTIREFGAKLRGRLIRPGDEGYESARKVWNGLIDKRPSLIVRCAGISDVVNSVNFARGNSLRVAVRGGGGGIAGTAVCDGGIVIDLSRMKGIRVDPVKRTATAQSGVIWREFDQETQLFGLATTGCPHPAVGIAGFTQGGGIGYLARKHGLAIDNLLSADIVTADGRFAKASAIDNPDLFWGIRGGGGNFGIVTSFEYQLHPLGPILGGMLIYPLSKAREVLFFYRDYIISAPDELSTVIGFSTAPALPEIPSHLHGTDVIAVMVSYTGPPEKAEDVVRPLRDFGPPEVDLIRTIPYTEMQTRMNPFYPSGLLNYWMSAYLNDLGQGAVDVLLDYVAKRTSSLSKVFITHLLGAIGRVGNDETAYSHRDSPFILAINSVWTERSKSEENIKWARRFWGSMRPYATSGTYANFLGFEEEEKVGEAYGTSTYSRLVTLKNRYDPENFFRFNLNVWPTKRPGANGPASEKRV